MTRKLGSRATGVVLLALCVVASARGQTAAAGAAVGPSAIVRRVDDHYNHLRSLRCNFVEHYAGLGAERTETGTLLLKKPGRMRWTYAEPVGKVFVLDGRYAWSYTPGDAQVQRVAAQQLDDLRSPLRFLLGRTRLEQELTGLSVTARGSGFHIAGVPRGMEQRVASLSLDVQASGVIDELRVEERDGSVTEFRFSDLAENVSAGDELFRFETPAGVPVVNGLPPI